MVYERLEEKLTLRLEMGFVEGGEVGNQLESTRNRLLKKVGSYWFNFPTWLILSI